jgi:hypothetical protein
MPNQNNYRTNLTTKTDPRFIVSRIINIPDATILNEEVPASFGFDRDDTAEIHFYTATSNQLILSTIVTLNDSIIKSQVVRYNDNTYKNYLRIDFTKLFVDKELVLIPGDYRMVLNFFSNEIGSYNDRILNIDVISDSRTEVQVSFNNTTDEVIASQNLYLVKEFVEKGFNRSDAVGVAEKIFVSGVQLEDSSEGLTVSNIEQNINIPLINQTQENTIQRIENLGIKQTFDEQVNNFLVEMYDFIKEEIVINGDERIQESEYKEILQKVVKEKINQFAKVVDSRIRVS